MNDGDAFGQFPATAWTVLQAVKVLPRSECGTALNDFIGRYWKPVFYFIRAKGRSLHEAEDLTQDFFLERLLKPDWLAKADCNRGRFRNFVLKNLQWFLADQQPGRARRQVAYEMNLVAVGNLLNDEDRSIELLGREEEAEDLYWKTWARETVNRALDRVEQFYKEEDRPAWYQLFAAQWNDSSDKPVSQEGLGEQFGMTRDQVRYAISVVGHRFAQYLRDEVRDQVGSDGDVLEEINDLMKILKR